MFITLSSSPALPQTGLSNTVHKLQGLGLPSSFTSFYFQCGCRILFYFWQSSSFQSAYSFRSPTLVTPFLFNRLNRWDINMLSKFKTVPVQTGTPKKYTPRSVMPSCIPFTPHSFLPRVRYWFYCFLLYPSYISECFIFPCSYIKGSTIYALLCFPLCILSPRNHFISLYSTKLLWLVIYIISNILQLLIMQE